MRKKFFAIILVFIPMFVGAQTYYRTQSMSHTRGALMFGAVYDWQVAKGGPFDLRESSNVGFHMLVDFIINPIWSFRLHAEIPGLMSGKSVHGKAYDRRGYAGADIVLNIKGLNEWAMQDDFYVFLGPGIAAGVGNTGLGFGGTGGTGYAHYFGRAFGVYAELKGTVCSGSNDLSLEGVLGVRLLF